MFKKILLVLISIFCISQISYSQATKIYFVDSTGTQREVSYKYPLPVKLKGGTGNTFDSTKYLSIYRFDTSTVAHTNRPTSFQYNVSALTFTENGSLLSSKYALALGNLNTSNLDTSNIGFLNQQNTYTENVKVPVLAIGSSGISPIPRVAVGMTKGDSNVIGFNLVNTTINTVRGSQNQATDSASASIRLTQWGGNPIMAFRSSKGVLNFNIDSIGTILTNSFLILGGSSGSSVRSITGGRIGFYDAGGGSFATLVGGELLLGGGARGALTFEADGVFRFTNTSVNGFTSATWGSGTIIAGFIRGTTLTTATGWFSKSPDGTTWYSYVNNSGTIVTSNTLF